MRRWLLLVGFLIALGLAFIPQPQSLPTELTDCTPVEHGAGTTCVPHRIQRLVALDLTTFEHAIALGLQPIGTVLDERANAHLENYLATVTNIGQTGSPNLERILKLKPDMIIGLDYHAGIYSQLSHIAPTVLIQFTHSGEWKSMFRDLGKFLNREAIAEQVLAQYNQRLHAFNHRLQTSPSATPHFPPKISVARIYPDHIGLYLKESFPGVILQDAGLARPVSQAITAAQAASRFSNPIQSAISLETIDQADGDVVFIWTSENTAAENETAQTQLARLVTNPLWNHLDAVQQNRVYPVSSYWLGSGAIAANAVIDDLERCLFTEVD